MRSYKAISGSPSKTTCAEEGSEASESDPESGPEHEGSLKSGREREEERVSVVLMSLLVPPTT
jgi:hypothetical protein